MSKHPSIIAYLSYTYEFRTVFFFTATRRLVFCPILVIISLALADGAFAAASLNTPSQIFQIKNHGPTKCTPIRWKDKWLKRPVFRDDPTSIGRPVPYYRLRDDMKRQALDAGFEEGIGPKAFRRGAANAANGTCPENEF